MLICPRKVSEVARTFIKHLQLPEVKDDSEAANASSISVALHAVFRYISVGSSKARAAVTSQEEFSREKRASDAASTLKAIEADFWTWRLQDAPQFATAVGDPRHNDVLESYDISVYKERELDQQIALLRHAISIGHTLNNVSVMAVPGQIDQIVQTSVQNSPLYQPAFTTTLDDSDVPVNKRVTMRSQAEAAVDEVYKALIRLKNVLEQEYIPAGRATWGVSGWPDGKALYEQCLKYHTSTDMTPQQVHDLGIREVQRIQTNMLETLKRLQYNGTIKEFYDSVRVDPRFHANSSEALLDMFKDYIYNRITPKLNTLFKDIPDLPLKVEPMPYDGPGGIYLAGTPDGSVPGIFYANVMHPAQTVTLSDMALVLHETVPGHHLQSIFSLSSNLPPYRGLVEDDHYYRMPATFPINTAYLEGWGLYAEYLGEEMGMYTDDYMLMGRYSFEIFRACRLVVDTGLHYFGWDRERAIQYFLDNTAESRDSMTTEVDRYLTWPGQATAYKVGEIRIRELRQKASDALGSKFDVREFHSVLLKNGGMPLNLLERLVDEWIADVTSGAAGVTSDSAGVTSGTSSTGPPRGPPIG
ncbi:hypothetical protein BaRGS_00007017 [Batillaria attramentaria]|uniref:DUF885 domain-containing protein n=1 Tax=Batillaria attramentaria TaxID=370345 RepID=A0ABD0LR06_9CAEN